MGRCCTFRLFFFCKQKTAYEMRISDWSSDVCSSDLSIAGTKIFISGGEHDLTENIIHLVLAKTPDAPDDVKGISLFIVPKVLVNDDGGLGARNEIGRASCRERGCQYV